MALIKCKDCGKEFSTDAKICPHCGAKKPKYALKTTEVLAVLLMVLLAFGMSDYEKSTAQEPPKTPQEIQASKIESENTNNAVNAKVFLQQHLKDPDSLEVTNAFATDNQTICIEYRAKNSFGGFSVESALYIPKYEQFYETGMNDFNRKWNKECANKTGTKVYI